MGDDSCNQPDIPDFGLGEAVADYVLGTYAFAQSLRDQGFETILYPYHGYGMCGVRTYCLGEPIYGADALRNQRAAFDYRTCEHQADRHCVFGWRGAPDDGYSIRSTSCYLYESC